MPCLREICGLIPSWPGPGLGERRREPYGFARSGLRPGPMISAAGWGDGEAGASLSPRRRACPFGRWHGARVRPGWLVVDPRAAPGSDPAGGRPTSRASPSACARDGDAPGGESDTEPRPCATDASRQRKLLLPSATTRGGRNLRGGRVRVHPSTVAVAGWSPRGSIPSGAARLRRRPATSLSGYRSIG